MVANHKNIEYMRHWREMCQRYEFEYCCEYEKRDDCEKCKVIKKEHINYYKENATPVLTIKYCHPLEYRQGCKECEQAPMLHFFK